MNWKIYYADGNTFDSTQGGPEDAPGYGVVLIVQRRDSVKADPHSGWDWYFYHNEFGWWGCDRSGMEDQMLNEWKNLRRIVMGRSVANTRYQEIWRRAKEDKDLPAGNPTKRGLTAGEQRYGKGSN